MKILKFSTFLLFAQQIYIEKGTHKLLIKLFPHLELLGLFETRRQVLNSAIFLQKIFLRLRGRVWGEGGKHFRVSGELHFLTLKIIKCQNFLGRGDFDAPDENPPLRPPR